MVLLKDKSYKIGNIDATVVLESPKLNPHIPKMKGVLAEILEIEIDDISIKRQLMNRLIRLVIKKPLNHIVFV